MRKLAKLVTGAVFVAVVPCGPALAGKTKGNQGPATGTGAAGAVVINPAAGAKIRVPGKAVAAKTSNRPVTTTRKGKVAKQAAVVRCRIVDVRSNQRQTVGQALMLTARKLCDNGTSYVSVFCVENCGTVPKQAPQRGTPPPPAPPEIIELPAASEARNAIAYTQPAIRFSPDVDDARTSNIGGYLVGMPMFFAVPTSAWNTLTATATRGPATITVEAEPIGLFVQLPGRVMECVGPGVVVTGDNYATASRECSHVFQENGSVLVSVQIKYLHSYSANFIPATPFPVNEISYSPATALTIPVVQVQPVIVSG